MVIIQIISTISHSPTLLRSQFVSTGLAKKLLWAFHTECYGKTQRSFGTNVVYRALSKIEGRKGTVKGKKKKKEGNYTCHLKITCKIKASE